MSNALVMFQIFAKTNPNELIYQGMVHELSDLVVPVEIPYLGECAYTNLNWLYEDFLEDDTPSKAFNWQVSKTIEKFGTVIDFKRELVVLFSRTPLPSEADIDPAKGN